MAYCKNVLRSLACALLILGFFFSILHVEYLLLPLSVENGCKAPFLTEAGNGCGNEEDAEGGRRKSWKLEKERASDDGLIGTPHHHLAGKHIDQHSLTMVAEWPDDPLGRGPKPKPRAPMRPNPSMSSDTTFRHKPEASFMRPMFPDAALEASGAAPEYEYDMRHHGARESRNGGYFSHQRQPREDRSHAAAASSHYSYPPRPPATSRSAPSMQRAGSDLLSPMQLHNMNSALSVQSGMPGNGREEGDIHHWSNRHRHESFGGNPGSPPKYYEHDSRYHEPDPYRGNDSSRGRGASREDFAHNHGCSPQTWRGNDHDHRDGSDQYRVRRNHGHRPERLSCSEYREPPPGMPLSPITCDVPTQVSVVRAEEQNSPRSEVAYSGSYDRHNVHQSASQHTNDYGNLTREHGHHPQHKKQTIDRPSPRYHDEERHYSNENRAPLKAVYHPTESFQYQYPEKRDDYSSSTINTPSTHPSTFQPSGSHPSHASGITTLMSRPQQQLPPSNYSRASNDRASHKLSVSIPQSPAHQQPQPHVSESYHSQSYCGSDSYKSPRLVRAEREHRLSHARHQILKEISQASHMRDTALDKKDTLFWTRQVNTLNESLKRL